MHANENPALNAVGTDVEVDLSPFLLGYKDGRVKRLLKSSFVAAAENPTANRGVATRDVVVDHSTGVSARLFLPTRTAMAGRRLPIVVYIHGGSFCTESAFCRTYHCYATSLAASAEAIVVSVEYRLAPEHPIPTAYDDAWSALRWVASLTDPWLANYADPRRTFLAGDSAGGNIAYHTTVRASRDGGMGVDIEGMIIVQPYFWGVERLPSEAVWDGAAVLPAHRVDWLWPFVTAGQAGNEDPRLNPPDEEIASLTCRRVLVAVAEKDTLRERGCRLFARIRDYYAHTGGEATLVESEGEDHGFHLYSPLRATSRRLMESIVRFINQPPAPELDGGLLWHAIMDGKRISRSSTMTTPELIILGVPSRPFRDIFGYGMDMKHHCSGSSLTTCMAYGTSKIGGGRGKAASSKKANYGLFTGPVRPNKACKGPAAAPLPGGTQAIKNFF
ncbi:putative carboxylesterase 13 [Panicum miliaceum]|uniref:Carboxylesterase 13 n=1 Tax=Panicum miliaceum TaxID=4540 RepID=A0A3L6TDB5_PANMI|nr:putative carboxylesterase 13 [Panicum miliaceum]